MNFPQSPKRYRDCEYVAEDGSRSVIKSQATGCNDLTGKEIYEFDMLALYCSWLNGILIAPILWMDESAGFDLDTDKAEILNQPKPDFIVIEVLPMMTGMGYLVGTVSESVEVIGAKNAPCYESTRSV